MKKRPLIYKIVFILLLLAQYFSKSGNDKAALNAICKTQMVSFMLTDWQCRCLSAISKRTFNLMLNTV